MLGFVVALLLVACQQQDAAASLGQPFELAPGQPVTISETGLQVQFNAVTEDSRCPAQVQCIWAGRASVELALIAPNVAPETVTLSTCCGPDQTHYEYAGQAIDLHGVAPGPGRPGAAISDADYRAQVTVNSL